MHIHSFAFRYIVKRRELGIFQESRKCGKLSARWGDSCIEYLLGVGDFDRGGGGVAGVGETENEEIRRWGKDGREIHVWDIY